VEREMSEISAFFISYQIFVWVIIVVAFSQRSLVSVRQQTSREIPPATSRRTKNWLLIIFWTTQLANGAIHFVASDILNENEAPFLVIVALLFGPWVCWKLFFLLSKRPNVDEGGFARSVLRAYLTFAVIPFMVTIIGVLISP
jgi:hypothetical protein